MNRAGKNSKPRAKASKPRAKARKTTSKQLRLPEVLDLTAAAPLAQSFLSRRGSQLSVDASRVRRVGAQCLQVLVAAEATWKSDGKRFRLVKPSEEFLDGSRLLGIQIDQDIAGREQAQ